MKEGDTIDGPGRDFLGLKQWKIPPLSDGNVHPVQQSLCRKLKDPGLEIYTSTLSLDPRRELSDGSRVIL